MGTAEPVDAGVSAPDLDMLEVHGFDAPDDVVDLAELEDTLEYEDLPRALLGAYLIG